MGANAVTSVPVYADGEVLEASRLNVTNSGIPVFATTTTRDAAFGGTGEKTLAEGQFAYIEASDSVQYYNGTSWLTFGGKIAQVVSTAKTDTFTTTSTSFVDITGLSVSITPTSNTSKILVMPYVLTGVSGDIAINARLMRDSTAILVGDAASNRPRDTYYTAQNITGVGLTFSPVYLDSPATTSATTYKVQVFVNSGTAYVNRSTLDRDTTAYDGRTASSITVLEVLA